MMSDRIDFSIDGVERIKEEMRESNLQNLKNKEAFLDYIDSQLAPEWNTQRGAEAVAELRNFVNTRFTDYVKYLDGKINAIENGVIPALKNINRA